MTWPRGGFDRRLAVGGGLIVAVALALLIALVLVPQARVQDSADGGGSAQTDPLRIGYIPYWDQDRGFDVVQRNPTLFDEISPVWYSLDRSGQVVLADDENTTVDPDMVDDLQDRGIRVVPTLTNLRNGEWNPEIVQAMLHRPETMRTHVREIVDLVVDQGYDGIDIDYETLNAADREPYTTFLETLGTSLHAVDKSLATAVHPKTSDEGDDEQNQAQDYRAIGAAVDQVRVMTYDYSWDTSPPGPVAPEQWVDDVIAWTVTQIPSHKVILGIDLLGYDWGTGPGVTVDYGQAQRTASDNDAPVRRTSDGTPWFTYRDARGARHEVWFEDAVSAKAKLELVSQYDLAGAFFWRLGGEDPAVWQSVDAGDGATD